MLDVGLSDFVHQEINLVEEEYHGDLLKDPVVDDGVENVPGLLDSVGLPVLQQHLVILRGGGHEQDTGH